MPSLFVPVFTKNPVQQPSPAILQFPPAGGNRPDIKALPSIISVMGFSAVASAIAALMRGPSSVAAPPMYLLRPFLRSQSRAQPISDALMYVMPGTGVGGGAGPRQGMENPESQPIREQQNPEPAANRLAFRNARLSIRLAPALCSVTTAPFVWLKTRAALDIFGPQPRPVPFYWILVTQDRRSPDKLQTGLPQPSQILVRPRLSSVLFSRLAPKIDKCQPRFLDLVEILVFIRRRVDSQGPSSEFAVDQLESALLDAKPVCT
jgi:hypothetical protein